MDEMTRTNWQTATDPTIPHPACNYPLIVDVFAGETFDGDADSPGYGQRVTHCPRCGLPLSLDSEKGER